jgi:hypothetical protein
MDWNDVTEYLQTEGVLPSRCLEISSIDELENELIRHVFSLEIKPECIVKFDAECIESTYSYTYLFEQFLSALSQDIGVKLNSSNIDFDKEVAFISAKKRSKLFESEWKQENDWVSEEFFKYVFEVTNNRSEAFFPIITGDQTALFICIDKKISNFLKKAKSDSEKSGVKFFMSQFGQGGPAYDFKFMSRKKHHEVQSEFKNIFMKGDSFEISSFSVEAIEILTHVDDQYIQESEEGIKRLIRVERENRKNSELNLYVQNNSIWKYIDFGSYGVADVFTKDSRYGILFESNVEDVLRLCHHVGGDDPPDLVLLGKDRKWAIVVSQSKSSASELYLVFLGTIVECIENKEFVKQINMDT